ncbi:MAG: Spy/CpxP family protein refolding chaperone [Blastocatellia bacterium]|nr:Spy/CpxP family protein refolding chaperone [Blastocatellia bacterium]
MKKLFGFLLLIGVAFGTNSVLFAQDGQNPPPPMEGKSGKFGKRGGPEGSGGMMRGRRGGGMRGDKRRGHRGGMRGGFGISDEEILKLNLTNDQKVKLFDFRQKMMTEREAMQKNRRPGEGMQPEGINREEMRQLMSAKQLGTLTAEQKSKLDSIEANRKQMMEKRKTEMEAMRNKMEQNQQDFLNIFTLDQRKQLEQIRAEKARQMQERMQQRQNRPQGGPGRGMKKAISLNKPE